VTGETRGADANPTTVIDEPSMLLSAAFRDPNLDTNLHGVPNLEWRY